MGLGSRKASSPEARKWLGNLLVAWTFVTGLSAAFASAWYGRTGDIKVLIAYLGAPFLVGVVLFTSLGVYALATRSAERDPVAASGRRHRRSQLFVEGTQARPRGPMAAALAGEPSTSWERVTIRGKPDENELTEFHRITLEGEHVRAALGVLAVAAAIAWAQLLAPASIQLDPYQLAPVALLITGTILLAALLGRPRRLARHATERETLLETTWQLGPEGVIIIDARGHGRYSWNDVSAVQEANGIIVLRTRDGASLVIPKHAAAGPETLGRVRAVLTTHVGDRAQLLASA